MMRRGRRRKRKMSDGMGAGREERREATSLVILKSARDGKNRVCRQLPVGSYKSLLARMH